jgi:hypothetical protein
MMKLDANPVTLSSYAGSTVSVVSSLTLTEIGIIVGIITALATFALNAFYTYRKDQREKLESRARLRALGVILDE